jgi:hypothetical protein
MTQSIKYWSYDLLLCVAFGSSQTMAHDFNPACGDLYLNKPTNYRVTPQEQLHRTEYPRFRAEYVTILKGQTTASEHSGSYDGLIAGFDDILRTFPNHHMVQQAIDHLG